MNVFTILDEKGGCFCDALMNIVNMDGRKECDMNNS
jgi:hypothetical protein